MPAAYIGETARTATPRATAAEDGGLLKMGELLNATGATNVFAESVGGVFSGLPWTTVLLLTLLVFFDAHYFLASITAHMLALFPPFVVMLTAVGVPPLLAAFSLLCLANLTAGLTHYGTTTGPILYSANYVTFAEWWRVGFVVSVVNLSDDLAESWDCGGGERLGIGDEWVDRGFDRRVDWRHPIPGLHRRVL